MQNSRLDILTSHNAVPATSVEVSNTIEKGKKNAKKRLDREVKSEEDREQCRIVTCISDTCTLTNPTEYINPRDKSLSTRKDFLEKEIRKVLVRTRKHINELVDCKVLDLINRIFLEVNHDKSDTIDRYWKVTAILLKNVSVYKYLEIEEDNSGNPTLSSFKEVQFKLISRAERLFRTILNQKIYFYAINQPTILLINYKIVAFWPELIDFSKLDVGPTIKINEEFDLEEEKTVVQEQREMHKSVKIVLTRKFIK
ncbi:hypothetical protein CWI39_0127p0030 [Hamiltosporidium magnivora]|uniref:Uncharacterized protein n=1 Tax=Hamiltosporidium magnivora TaxID=148818 RepID=A0A4Q9LKV2_9MICR|nr:hypothetical protein CWI39_0127p0030 [Hamiltosporidium magnivora]